MSKSFVFVVLVLLFGTAAYFLGKKNGSDHLTTTVVQNVNLVQQIAELSSLSVAGTTTVKLTNTNENAGFWNKFKNYLAENTLLVTLPYEAKYGVALKDQKAKIDTKGKTIQVYLPRCKLLSLQLRLDKLETMNQTGLFATTTIADLSNAQKQLYQQAFNTLTTNQAYIKQSEEQIISILKKYYEPLDYTVECIFGDIKTASKN
ncbi:DUF4230 domain-containing protein [Ferruginibacter sp. SUN002]|uniref:DUF4230 domain-containing protein n=1 Tax=Ferruginibacter sp. SUN002 TaxID=2937789 RepID=UPI003D35F734